MACLFIVGSLWKGCCHFGKHDPQLEKKTREAHESVKIRTVSKCGDHRDECGIERVAVIIDTCRIDV